MIESSDVLIITVIIASTNLPLILFGIIDYKREPTRFIDRYILGILLSSFIGMLSLALFEANTLLAIFAIVFLFLFSVFTSYSLLALFSTLPKCLKETRTFYIDVSKSSMKLVLLTATTFLVLPLIFPLDQVFHSFNRIVFLYIASLLSSRTPVLALRKPFLAMTEYYRRKIRFRLNTIGIISTGALAHKKYLGFKITNLDSILKEPNAHICMENIMSFRSLIMQVEKAQRYIKMLIEKFGLETAIIILSREIPAERDLVVELLEALFSRPAASNLS